MGEIRRVINGVEEKSVGNFEGNLLGQPFACIYGNVEPRVAKGHTLIKWPLCGKLNIYIRFSISNEVENFLQEQGEGNVHGSVVFTEEIAEHFNYNKDKILIEALEFLYKNYSIRSMLATLMGDDMADAIPDDEPQKRMQVINTKCFGGCYGAGVLANKNILEEIRAKEGDFYIIPSSIHECIVIPKDLGGEVSVVKDMINEVNASVVDPTDVLSDNLYLYDSEGLKEL